MSLMILVSMSLMRFSYQKVTDSCHNMACVSIWQKTEYRKVIDIWLSLETLTHF